MSASCSKRCSKAIWPLLTGATFVCCSLIIYAIVVNKEKICSIYGECLESSGIRKDALTSHKCPSVCTTKECIEISNDILSFMDQSVSPCDDFFAFACGKYKETFHEDNKVLLMDLKLELEKTLKDILEDTTGTSDSAVEKVRTVYDSCMRTNSSDFLAAHTLQNFLSEVGIPNWPHLNSSFAFEDTTLEEVLGKLLSYQQNIFLSFEEDEDYSFLNMKGNLLSLSVVPKSFQNEDENFSHLKKFLNNFLRFLDLDHMEVEEILEDVLTVEKAVLELSSNSSIASKDCMKQGAVTVVFKDCTLPKNNESKLCPVLVSTVRNGKISSRISEDQYLVKCENDFYLKNLFAILENYSDRAVANYIALRVFINNMAYLNLPVRKSLQYNLDLTDELEKWKICIDWLMKYMKTPVGHIYVSHIWPEEAVKQIDEILDEYKTEILNFVKKQDWLDQPIKEDLIFEVQKKKSMIPDFIESYRNETQISNAMKEFRPTRSNFVQNILENKKFTFTSTFLHPPNIDIPAENALTYPFDVSGFILHGIYLSFGILLPPFFHHDYPKIFNFAKIGWTVGHEFGHQVYQYLEPTDDDGEIEKESHYQMQKCLVDQYFDFNLKKAQRNLLGNQTVEENFCDQIGMKVTEKLAEKYLDEMKENMFALPGLHYSPEELLYISFAQGWCDAPTINRLIQYIEKDVHSPPEYRVKGPLFNSRRFSEVFNCPYESYMNPENKCSVFH